VDIIYICIGFFFFLDFFFKKVKKFKKKGGNEKFFGYCFFFKKNFFKVVGGRKNVGKNTYKVIMMRVLKIRGDVRRRKSFF
jgi:hypothetical protein